MQLTVDVSDGLYQDMSLLLSAAHGLSVEEYLEGHLKAYWNRLNSKHEGQEKFFEMEMLGHYLYHETLGDSTISEEEFP